MDISTIITLMGLAVLALELIIIIGGVWAKKDISRLSKKVASIDSYLRFRFTDDFTNFDKAVFHKSSPVNLTDTGKEIAQKLNAESIAQKYLADVKRMLSSDSNAYEIQEASFGFSTKNLPEALGEKTKNIIEREAFERGLNVIQMYRIIGILIRNKICDERNIPYSSIDDNDPNKK